MLSNRQQELQLIEAVAAGNLEIVRDLVENNAVNVNCAIEMPSFLKKKKKNKALALISKPNDTFDLLTTPTYKTPLSESIIHSRNAIFDYLIAMGANIDITQQWFRYDIPKGDSFFTRSMLALACSVGHVCAVTYLLPREKHLDSIRLTIRHTKKVTEYERQKWVTYYLPKDFLKTPFLYNYTYLSLFIYQAILSCNKIALGNIATGITNREEMKAVNLCGTSFQEYLGPNALTSNQALRIEHAIRHLANLRLVNLQIRDDLLEVVRNVTDHKLKSAELKFKDLPEFLQIACERSTQRQMPELFAEFTRYLYFGQKLPAVTTTNSYYKEEDYDLSKAEIELIQNPLNLRTFLDLGDTEIKKQLGLCIDVMDGNAAAELLAQMLYLCNQEITKEKKKKKEKGEKEEKPQESEALLSHEQIQKGLRLLIELDSMSQENKLKLSVARHQLELNAQMQSHTERVENTFREQNKILTNAVHSLTETNQQLTETVQSLAEQVKLLANSLSHLNDEHKSMKKQLDKMSQEKSADTKSRVSHALFK